MQVAVREMFYLGNVCRVPIKEGIYKVLSKSLD